MAPGGLPAPPGRAGLLTPPPLQAPHAPPPLPGEGGGAAQHLLTPHQPPPEAVDGSGKNKKTVRGLNRCLKSHFSISPKHFLKQIQTFHFNVWICLSKCLGEMLKWLF